MNKQLMFFFLFFLGHSKDLIREGGGISKLTEILKEDTNEYLSLQTVWALALLLENDRKKLH